MANLHANLLQANGLQQPLISVPRFAIRANRAPTSNDTGYNIGQIWVYLGSAAYILIAVANASATWQVFTTSGGGTFTSLTVTGPSTLTGTTNINTTGAAVTTIGTGGTGAVNIGNATGNTNVTGSLTASVDLTATAGDIVATVGLIEGVSLVATGDAGGNAGDVTFTNANVAVAGGTGAFTMTSTTGAGTGTNAGYLKFYLGATAVYVPYFTATT